MTQEHPELAAEQAYVDHAYECLERTRTSAWRLRDLTEAASRDPRIAGARDRLEERLRGLAAEVRPRTDYAVVHGELDLVGIGFAEGRRVGGEEIHHLATAPALGDAVSERGDFLVVHGNVLRTGSEVIVAHKRRLQNTRHPDRSRAERGVAEGPSLHDKP